MATPHAGRGIAISAGSLAVLLGALDTYVVVTIMRDIISTIGIPVNHLQRITPIITWYLLGYIAAMPLLGRASDRFGRKLLLQVSLATFLIGSVITALSTDLDVLVVGRTIQGVASGALLPVTLALGADLWAQRNRAGVLGGIGAAQELGSVLGPLYGIFIVWLTSRWQDVFWINVPLALAAMLMIHFSLPSRDRDDEPEKIDVIGGLLLAITLGLAVIGLYNANPDGKHALPSYGPPLIVAAVVAAVIFFVWERFSRTKLIEPTGVHFRPFLSALGASLCAGAALMVTLVDVELFAQGVLGKDQDHAAMMLLWFLAALPVGALVGGWIATRVGDRVVAFAGLLIAAGGYWLISKWSVGLLDEHHNVFGLVSLPALDTDLAIAGIGLGLVIAPLTSASLRVVPSAQHGIASAAVVVARMTGMLIGVASLSAWGFYRLPQLVAKLASELPANATLTERVLHQATMYRQAFAGMYGEIFKVTVVVCIVGALLGLLISSRRVHADEPLVREEQPVGPQV
ncbi:aminoglycoside/tetracycline transporter [Mycobacterium cookii]|uniref:MFS-type drug efflux transporter P55 n=1 Tax=Mycobacterium cookii TaxID=1775 RepID=A0A7I7KQL1_9MYCO|nr:MFS transporter [Mycobacterium cookii]MCV7332424.1 MFS transporter [Mycobacterium cookii]BBX44450.1 putative triacylglyceride transporter [Mycobacterium cookii]